MATTAISATGPTSHRTLDLDAGTTLPRVIPIAAAVILIAGIAVTLLAGHAWDRTSSVGAGPRITPQAITAPALRPAMSHYPTTANPSWPVGPAASLVSLAGVLDPGADAIGL